MAHKRVIARLQVCGSFIDEYLKNVESNSFRTENALNHYKQAKGTYPLDQLYLFAENDDVITEINDDADEKLEEDDRLKIVDLVFAYNLMTLVYHVANRSQLDTCCNNFLKEVFKYKEEYMEKAMEFDIALRNFALRSSLHGREDYDLQNEVDLFFPPGEDQRELYDKMIDAWEMGNNEDENMLDLGRIFNPQELDKAMALLIREVYSVRREQVPQEHSTEDEYSAAEELPSLEEEETTFEEEEETITEKYTVVEHTVAEENLISEEDTPPPPNNSKRRFMIRYPESSSDEDVPFIRRENMASSKKPKMDRNIFAKKPNSSNASEPSSSRPVQPSTSTSTSSVRPNSGPSGQTTKPRTDDEVREAVDLHVSFEPPPKDRKKPERWTDAEVDALKRGLSLVKAPRWTEIKIKMHPALQKRSNVQLKDKAKTELKKLARQGKTERSQLGVWQYVDHPE